MRNLNSTNKNCNSEIHINNITDRRMSLNQKSFKLTQMELKVERLTMDENVSKHQVPVDKYHLIYFAFILHGIGVLTAWNMFITAESYFTDYKWGVEYVGSHVSYAESYLQYVTFASQIPNLIFNWANIFLKIGGNLTTRIVWSITVEVIIFIVTIGLAMTNTSTWPETFFWITMITVVILHTANAIYQNTVYGLAAMYPSKYTGAAILGNNISGTFAAVVSILSTSFTSNRRLSAVYFFITALFVLLVCFDSYFALPINRFYRHYQSLKKEHTDEKDTKLEKEEATPYFYIFKKASPQLFNIFFVYFVTLSIFPAIQAKVRQNDPDFLISEKYFTPVTCFLTYNISATIGSYIPTFFIWPKPKYLFIPVLLRVIYIPLFLFSNYHVSSDLSVRTLPVFITNDWVYWILAITMGLTAGYFISLGMMYAPKCVEEKYAGTAGMFGGASLVSGIFGGVCATFIWPELIKSIS